MRKNRLKEAGTAASEAARISGRGFRPSKRFVETEARRKSAAEKVDAIRRSGVVNHSESSAALALRALQVDDGMDFDAAVRLIKRGVRDATTADAIVDVMQRDAIENHDREGRRDDGTLADVPPTIAEHLGTDWRLYAHSAQSSLKHVRGSFPEATRMASVIAGGNTRTKFVQAAQSKLLGGRAEMHKPARHSEVPSISQQAAATHTLACHAAGFCVHGSVGANVQAMHSQLMRTLVVNRFPKHNKVQYKEVQESGVVICAISEHRPKVSAAAVGVAALPAKRIVNKWVHIGLLERQPRRFSCQLLTPSGDTPPLALDDEAGEMTLGGMFTFENSWAFVRHLVKHHVWYLRFFYIIASQRPLGTITAGKCTAKELKPWPRPENLIVCFWNGEVDVEKAQRAARKKAEDAAEEAAAKGHAAEQNTRTKK